MCVEHKSYFMNTVLAICIVIKEDKIGKYIIIYIYRSV